MSLARQGEPNGADQQVSWGPLRENGDAREKGGLVHPGLAFLRSPGSCIMLSPYLCDAFRLISAA